MADYSKKIHSAIERVLKNADITYSYSDEWFTFQYGKKISCPDYECRFIEYDNGYSVRVMLPKECYPVGEAEDQAANRMICEVNRRIRDGAFQMEESGKIYFRLFHSCYDGHIVISQLEHHLDMAICSVERYWKVFRLSIKEGMTLKQAFDSLASGEESETKERRSDRCDTTETPAILQRRVACFYERFGEDSGESLQKRPEYTNEALAAQIALFMMRFGDRIKIETTERKTEQELKMCLTRFNARFEKS